jgi:hypothetical protein
MTKDRFDLEQEILDCWGICDDLETIYSDESLNLNDRVLNVLLGLKELYHMKFERTFATFENLVTTRQFNKTIM